MDRLALMKPTKHGTLRHTIIRLLDPEEIDVAKKSMSSFAFRQEFMASFEAIGSEIFKEDWITFDEEEPEVGDYYVAVDLAGFSDVGSISKGQSSRLD
jgi:hypothetical protein